jgi:peptide/nickel transport system substrate-binding protein
LRQGVRFHDGRPLTSADVKFTFESILNPATHSPKAGAFRMLASIDAPDPAIVVFHLKEPYASFLWNLARPAVGILPRDAGGDFSGHPIGISFCLAIAG